VIFSYIGFISVEETVGLPDTINVTLQDDVSVLDEVVITAIRSGRTYSNCWYKIGV